jgi:hypothetical protein
VTRANYLFRGIYIRDPFVGYSDKNTFTENAFFKNVFTKDAFLRNAAFANTALAIIIFALTRSLNTLF